MVLKKEEKLLFRLLFTLKDEDGIVRSSPESLGEEMDVAASYLDELLEGLCDKGVLIYVTRTNKATGEVLKVIQLL